MSQLTFREFARLPRKVQNERYKELSDHDKFLARMNDWGGPDHTGNEPLYWKPTEEEIQHALDIAHGKAT